MTIGRRTFADANEWLTTRPTVPTTMTSAELALSPDFPAAVRTNSFFSAQVDNANALETVRRELASYAAGDLDLATARWRCKTALTRLGYNADDIGMVDAPPFGMDPVAWKESKKITNLASTRRLNLILSQNARMAWAVGRKQVSEHPAIVDRWPNYVYIARPDARPEHAELDGICLPKDDPFWRTHTPPLDFNCRCDIEDSAAPANATAQTSDNPDGSQTSTIVSDGEELEVAPAPSGYVFDSAAPFESQDLERIANPEMRANIAAKLKDKQA